MGRVHLQGKVEISGHPKGLKKIMPVDRHLILKYPPFYITAQLYYGAQEVPDEEQ